MKTVRTKKVLKAPIKKRQQRILAKAFGTDREPVKPFQEDDRGEDRKFKTSLPGFEYIENLHEASRHISKIATVTMSSKGRITIPREIRTLMNIKPGQLVDVTQKDGVVHIVPIRQSRKSERGSLPRLKPFVRDGRTDYQSRLKQTLETQPPRLGQPINPTPSKMKKIWRTV
jgi:AbrB family looped-hinge helix DNA binding protein